MRRSAAKLTLLIMEKNRPDREIMDPRVARHTQCASRHIITKEGVETYLERNWRPGRLIDSQGRLDQTIAGRNSLLGLVRAFRVMR